MRKQHGPPGKKANRRWYRSPAAQDGEASFQVVLAESDLWITVHESCLPEAKKMALDLVAQARTPISTWIEIDPVFKTSLVPLDIPAHAPALVRRMGDAARHMGVGPMATVAGAVAEHVAAGLSAISPDCLVENGGDSMLWSQRERVVALLPDPSGRAHLGLRLEKGSFPLSLCASSGTFGHSLSFGNGDLAVARSRNACLADAAATALCNRLKGPGDAGKTAEFAASFKECGLDGVFVQCCGEIGVWGDMELVFV